MAQRPRRILPYVLLMSAFQIGNPVETFIEMVVDDLPRQSRDSCVQWFHVDPLSFYSVSHILSRSYCTRHNL